MRRSETADLCACGEPLPYRRGRGRKPAVCEDCRVAERRQAARARRARRKVEIAPSGRLCEAVSEGAEKEKGQG